MGIIDKSFFPLICAAFICSASQQSHREAATELIKIVQQEDIHTFVDTIVNRIIASQSDFAKHRDEIYRIINTYVRSDQFQELRLQAVMYYFTESQIRALIRQLQNPQIQNSPQRRSDLLNQYRKTYAYLEQKFIEYVRQKLKKRYEGE